MEWAEQRTKLGSHGEKGGRGKNLNFQFSPPLGTFKENTGRRLCISAHLHLTFGGWSYRLGHCPPFSLKFSLKLLRD